LLMTRANHDNERSRALVEIYSVPKGSLDEVATRLRSLGFQPYQGLYDEHNGMFCVYFTANHGKVVIRDDDPQKVAKLDLLKAMAYEQKGAWKGERFYGTLNKPEIRRPVRLNYEDISTLLRP